MIRNAIFQLGEGWQLQVVHGTANGDFVRGLFSAEGEQVRERVQLLSLGVDNLTRQAYSELLCSHWLWERVAAEHVLLFQTDSLICRRGIDEFLGYDYVGAPWRTEQPWCRGVPWLAGSGNGGFSLRRRSSALAAIDTIDCGARPCQPEDVYFAENLPRVGASVAPREVAARFSVESVWEGCPAHSAATAITAGSGGHDAPRPRLELPFGFHAAFKFLPVEQMALLLDAICYDAD